MERRKLIALEPDDLSVISAHVQDAAVHPRDILWRPGEKRLIVGLRRLDWDRLLHGDDECHRVNAALRFERVLSCQARNVDVAGGDALLNLLAVEFEPQAAPSGIVHLIFSGDATLRITVECLECELADLAASSIG